MSEYIKKEDLFNKTIKRNSIWNEITNAEGKGLEEIVNDLPTYSFFDSAENNGKWIPVSERLPEKNTRCLVAVGLFNLTQIATYSNLMGTIDHRIFYQGDYGRENFEDITEYVKAWQPLPEPYKKGE